MIKNTDVLTKKQIQNLLRNAYGFVDRNGVLFHSCYGSSINTHDFRLDAHGHNSVEFSYDNATFVNGTVTFETHDADTESFTVLIVAKDGLNVRADLLG